MYIFIGFIKWSFTSFLLVLAGFYTIYHSLQNQDYISCKCLTLFGNDGTSVFNLYASEFSWTPARLLNKILENVSVQVNAK